MNKEVAFSILIPSLGVIRAIPTHILRTSQVPCDVSFGTNLEQEVCILLAWATLTPGAEPLVGWAGLQPGPFFGSAPVYKRTRKDNETFSVF